MGESGDGMGKENVNDREAGNMGGYAGTKREESQ